MNKEDLHRLFKKYINNECTSEEVELLLRYFETNAYNKNLRGLIAEQLEVKSNLHDDKKQLLETAFFNIQQTIQKPVNKVSLIHINRRLIAAAAILVFVITGAALLVLNRNTIISSTKKIASQTKILPGRNKAILQLANGEKIVLDSLNNEVINENAGVIKAKNGQLIYGNNQTASQEINYNTVSIPNGGQYQIVLSDGTKVWLNSASSLHYPVTFIGKERTVELTGEAYFEVAKNAGMPFKVKVKNTIVEVLGTHFNVMAYDNEENLKTTLLEGAVKISAAGNVNILKPGQQLQLNNAGNATLVANADVDEAVAWKNGLFRFNDADISSIMKQLARWYDIDISFEGKIPPTHFGGEVSRNSDLSQVLKILETSGIHFKLEGRQLTVQQ